MALIFEGTVEEILTYLALRVSSTTTCRKSALFNVPDKEEIKKVASASYLRKRDISAANPKSQKALMAFAGDTKKKVLNRPERARVRKKCTVVSCESRAHTAGVCRKHWDGFQKFSTAGTL